MKSLADLFAKHIGVREYNGIVATIQKWFYGSLVKASWCATSTSYFMNQLGKLDVIGGKNENVYNMMNACKKYAQSHSEVQFFDKKHIPAYLHKDDILFYLWSGDTMKTTSDKHVCICYQDTASSIVPSIGGNQQDQVMIAQYPKANLYAVYRWNNERDYGYVGWHQDEKGWWYADTKTTYYKSCWQLINHHWYYFDENGYALKGLQTVDGQQYVFETSGQFECACMLTSSDGSLHSWYVS